MTDEAYEQIVKEMEDMKKATGHRAPKFKGGIGRRGRPVLNLEEKGEM